MNIFYLLSPLLAIIMRFIYGFVGNYGWSIIIFTVLIGILRFPLAIKQQKSMARMSVYQPLIAEIQKKYANNRQKQNEELMKLYEKEGVNPSSGCLVSMLPLPIMLGIYYSVIMPLSNTLHISSDAISLATSYISKLPGVLSSSGGGLYSEMEIIRNFDVLKNSLTMFTPEDLDKIEFFSQGFHFFGMDLLASPQTAGFLSFLWIIPLLSLLSNFGMQFYMSRVQRRNCQYHRCFM